jgi:hypothetical protein
MLSHGIFFFSNKRKKEKNKEKKTIEKKRNVEEGGVVTLALGSRLRQRGCKSVGQEEAHEPHHIPGSVRKCEGVNPHTPKVTPTLGDGVPVDFQNFREQFKGSKLNGLWRSLYHWKALGT